jgi:hypothetical protein
MEISPSKLAIRGHDRGYFSVRDWAGCFAVRAVHPLANRASEQVPGNSASGAVPDQ